MARFVGLLAEDDLADGLAARSPHARDRDVGVALEQRQVGVELVEPTVDERLCRAREARGRSDRTGTGRRRAVLDVRQVGRSAGGAFGRVRDLLEGDAEPGTGSVHGRHRRFEHWLHPPCGDDVLARSRRR